MPLAMIVPTDRRALPMGMTTLRVKVSNPADASRSVEQDMLVDSGAIFPIVPEAVLAGLGVAPDRVQEFQLADGTPVRRKVGIARFEYDGHSGGVSVIFGEPGDATLLGVLALEPMGFMLDPIRRSLRPLTMML
jgi:predicted aspartyl protease